MTTLAWIVVSSIAMSVISLAGAVTWVIKKETLDKLLLPLVAFAAGSLIGGAVLHMIPEAVDQMHNRLSIYLWLLAGFMLFLGLEQFLHWHHTHSATADDTPPLTYLILIADAIHNLIGGMFVAASFMVDVQLGVTAWLVAAAHEVPQELGDFGVLVHGGWTATKALAFNFFCSMTFLAGGILAYAVSNQINVVFLVPFAAGNFLYIGAADLIPEIKHHHRIKTNIIHYLAFSLGIALLLAVRLIG
ncbi:ZIP family metal transporter [Novipirellula artificiosorum]|uniref:Zinc transporter ZupT n=1 Tax=Novipirellula artificiosorum TaxID=2528016 RepID=A0A5C6DS72_9BACT|nr:ZIP family metal transporter [Novipirellula artificiosorum]TWU38341.1 zinc transporter ZupT [Novipirellula artificiosorum]